MKNSDEYMEYLINSIPTDNYSSTYGAVLTEAKITTQKIQDQTKEILSNLGKNKTIIRTGKLILLCANLESVYTALSKIKHEYNL